MTPASFAARDKCNWLVHSLYLRDEHDECLRIIEEQLRQHKALCEYPLYVKGLLRRQQGSIQESLQLFRAAACLNPKNPSTLKQIARSLFLLGRHKAATEAYAEAERLLLDLPEFKSSQSSDASVIGRELDEWGVLHHRGLCLAQMKQYSEAERCFLKANEVARHDSTYIALGQVYAQQDKFKKAIDTYTEALEFTPENSDLLTTVGLLYLRLGDSFKAFESFGNSLAQNPRAPRAILASGSLIQDRGDFDVALVKYRVAALQIPNSSQLWNNIGMCFFGKQKHVAAIACLKRALYLDPLEWTIAYNLGLLHLHTAQYASAFHYFTTSINLRPTYAGAYTHLGIALMYLDDVDNAIAAFERGLVLDPNDHVAHLNFAIALKKGQRGSLKNLISKELQRFDELSLSLNLDQDDESIKVRKLVVV